MKEPITKRLADSIADYELMSRSGTLLSDAKARIERLEGVLDWIVRVALDPSLDKDMALFRIGDEARKAMTASQ